MPIKCLTGLVSGGERTVRIIIWIIEIRIQSLWNIMRLFCNQYCLLLYIIPLKLPFSIKSNRLILFTDKIAHGICWIHSISVFSIFIFVFSHFLYESTVDRTHTKRVIHLMLTMSEFSHNKIPIIIIIRPMDMRSL